MVVILVLLTIIVFLTVDYAVQVRSAGAAQPAAVVAKPPELRPDRLPEGLFWSPGHAWLRVERRGTVRVGSGGLPLLALGGVDAVDLPLEGRAVHTGDTLATLRRGDRTVRLVAPVDGTVEKVNARVGHDPATLNRAPFTRGWLCRIRPDGLAAAIRRSFVAEEARSWMRTEMRELREMLHSMAPSVAVGATLPDGGPPSGDVAQQLDDEQWDRLTTRFFDHPRRFRAD